MSDTFPRSEVLSMKDMVEYAAGSVIRMQVIKMPDIIPKAVKATERFKMLLSILKS